MVERNTYYRNEVTFATDTATTFEAYSVPVLQPIESFDVRRKAGTDYRDDPKNVPNETTPWQESKACLNLPPGMFYPEDYDLPAIKAAKLVCDQCSVREECLEEVMARRDEFGIAGGLTAKERQRLVRQRKRSRRT